MEWLVIDNIVILLLSFVLPALFCLYLWEMRRRPYHHSLIAAMMGFAEILGNMLFYSCIVSAPPEPKAGRWMLTITFVPRFTLRPKAERWLINLSFWIPRKYREAITGDILEDCREMREKGFRERRICIHVLWQFAIAVIALWPEAMGSAVATITKRVWGIRK